MKEKNNSQFEFLKENILKYNTEEIVLSDDEQPIGIIAEDKEYLKLLSFGVPIGLTVTKDSLNRLIDDYNLNPVGEVTDYYIPINSEQEYEESFQKYHFVDLMIHPRYMNNEQSKHVLFCTGFAYDNNFFSDKTIKEIDNDLAKQYPLDYQKCMNIFNKYYTEPIKQIFLNAFRSNEEMFYDLSGLSKIVKKEFPNINLSEVAIGDYNYQTKSGKYLHFHSTDGGYDYSYYDENKCLLDGGVIDTDKTLKVKEVLHYIHTFLEKDDLKSLDGLFIVDNIEENIKI